LARIIFLAAAFRALRVVGRGDMVATLTFFVALIFGVTPWIC
jgi:hypothetical protein